MKYLCLVYTEEAKLQNFPEDECVAFDESLQKSGHEIAAEALQPVQTATTVRVRNGKVSITDGPFAETKEYLAGYFLIDAEDLDTALAWAARIPSSNWGSTEVRPVRG